MFMLDICRFNEPNVKLAPPRRLKPIITRILSSTLFERDAVKSIAVILPKPRGIIENPLKNAV